ncbi:hypothetical protein BG004_006269 [Podila humilis]|nr:hypothetical protein BG004_006269 [Podila humilis]
MASSGSSVKRPSSINSGSGYIPTSPVGSLATSISPNLHDDAFSNNPEDYDIRLPIGYGSSAVVYNAYYKPLNKRVAIKVIDLDMFERNQIDELRRETQVMALCKHANVLRVNGAFVADSKLYIVTPYLSAGSCLDIMKTAYPDGFDEISIATILKQALQDVKAGNLLVDDDGSVLLGDFGVSSSLMENGDRRGMRKTFVGTPCWMAPEVMEQAGYDYKADIWSFGITAIELATGHAPFAKYPPIKVLMLTLSNDPPTLDRESTKHRYSKLLKEMIDCCLQKDPTRRPSAEKLLNHSFFKQAKKKSYLVSALLHNLPPLEQRPPKKAPPKATLPQKGVSWDFDGDDTPANPELAHGGDGEPVRRPRTVTFEPSGRPLSTATTESSTSVGAMGTPVMESRILDNMSEDGISSQNGTQALSPSADKPVKKSRFTVEESAASSPSTSYGATLAQEHSQTPSVAVSPSPSYSVMSSIQSGQNLQGLGVTGSTPDSLSMPEVKKGRFSVKDTTLSISSPVPGAMKVMGSETLLSPSRSLSSSPTEGTPDGVRIGGLPEQGPPSSERKSRFEVHHNHGTPGQGTSTATNGAGANSPVLSSTRTATIPRDASQSRMTNESVLSRDSSATRVSRFSVEPNQSQLELPSNSQSSTAVSTAGTPNPSNGPSSIQSKKSRFQVSSIEGTTPLETPGSLHSTPSTSPSGSLTRGQVASIDAQGGQFVQAHLETLYRQTEQQRAILSDLFAGLGLKMNQPGGKQATTLAEPHAGMEGSLHRQESGVTGQATLERQLQITTRENESLRRENEALKRELDRLRRGGLFLQFNGKSRLERLQAISEYIVNALTVSTVLGSHEGFDVVGLQEVWMVEDYERMRGFVKNVFPYSRHWISGLYGCGLAVFSRYPIIQESLHRYSLNGDPAWCFHGDWYDGKSCSSVVIDHPRFGELQAFNTHMHACYDQPGTRDYYLGSRVSQGWEMAGLVRQAAALGRHVLSFGDFNSPPDSLVVKLVTQYGGMTDSWDQLHPAPSDVDIKFMTIDEQIAALGITCDTPANSWNEEPWTNDLTRSKIGERLDYIFYRATSTFQCIRVQVVLREPILGFDSTEMATKNCSDHFGVHAIFEIQPNCLINHPSTVIQRQSRGLERLEGLPKDDVVDTLESVLVVLKQYHDDCKKKSRMCSIYIPATIAVVGLAVLVSVCLVPAEVWWQSVLVLASVSILSIIWAVSFLYGFVYVGENLTKTHNFIQEVQAVLDLD